MEIDINKVLLDFTRTVLATFYTPLHIILFDALIRYRGIRDEELAEKLHLDPQEIRKSLVQLQDIYLVENKHITEKTEAGKDRINAQYTINFPSFVNSIKFLLRKLEIVVEEESKRLVQYECGKCGSIYDQIELPRLGPMLLCVVTRGGMKCNGQVEEHQVERDVKLTKDSMTQSLRPIYEMLKIIDDYLYIKDLDKFIKKTDYDSLLKEEQVKDDPTQMMINDTNDETLEMIIGDEMDREITIKVEEYPFFLQKPIFE
jgi:transcription initiation factor IIE alpha subunit